MIFEDPVPSNSERDFFVLIVFLHLVGLIGNGQACFTLGQHFLFLSGEQEESPHDNLL